MLKIKGKFNEAVVFSEDQEIGSGATALIFNALNNETLKDETIRIMPDYHVGKDCLIGYTQTFNNQNLINPDILGVDLGCGVKSVKFKLDKEIESLELIDQKIRNAIPTGVEINKKSVVLEKEFRKFFKNQLERARSLWPDVINFKGLGEIDKLIDSTIKRLGQEPSIFWKSLGTLGGGNHFIEVGQDDDKGSVWITVHTGSRNLGIKVHSYWKKICNKKRVKSKSSLKEEENRIRKLYAKQPNKIKEEILKLQTSEKYFNLPDNFLKGDEVSEYISDVIFAQAYSKYNRSLIINRIKDSCKFGKELESIESIHNYIDPIDKILRKGAIRATEGELLVIPINMSFGTLVCRGKGNKEWNYSAPHGAGRILSRSEAKSCITLDDFKKSMEGVFSSSIVPECIDECPLAYKSPESIISQIGETLEILYVIKPIISIKGS